MDYPADTSTIKVFLLTTLGIAIPTSLGMSAGAVAASTMNNNPEWKDAYNQHGAGDLLLRIYHPSGFSHFVLVLLVLSVINTNIMNSYSGPLSLQQTSQLFARIPRFIWTFVCFVIVIGLSLGGSTDLNGYLQSFESLLGYWCTSYFVIMLEEHLIIRKGDFSNYNLEAWNSPHALPHGIAAFISFGLGVVAWVMGMSENWFVGPLAKLFGGSGGDLANEFTFVVSGVTYLPLRVIELYFYRR